MANGEFGAIPKGLVKGLEDMEISGQVETIKTTTLLRSSRESLGDLRRLAEITLLIYISMPSISFNFSFLITFQLNLLKEAK